jgi:queuosine precursor transporter
MQLDRRLTLFFYLVGIFLTCLIVGDLTGGKLTQVDVSGPRIFSVGQLAFPITFVLTDIFNEFYGRKTARQVTYLSFVMVGLALAIINTAALFPFADFTKDPNTWGGVTPDAFDRVFTSANRIQLSSMCAFLTAQLIDISIFFLIKKATGNRFLWLRATGSTVVSQLIDTIVITSLAFGHLRTFDEITDMIINSYIIKLCWAVGMTPVIYGIHELLERVMGIPPLSPAERAADVGNIK